MTVRQYTPLGIAIFFGICALAHYTHVVPVPLVAIISFAALTGLAFEVEDGKLGRMVHELMEAFHQGSHHHAH